MAHRDGNRRCRCERHRPSEHLVEHDAERVDVGLRGDLLAECLLGGDVVGRAEHATVQGQPLLGERPRDAEVRDLGSAFGAEKDVLGLDVAMHDPVFVRDLQATADLDRVRDRLLDVELAFATDALLERLAFDVLEDDVGSSLGLAPLRPLAVELRLAGVDHGDDVRVDEPSHRARLAAEALELVGVARVLAVQELDRNGPLQDAVERAVDG